MKTFIRSTLAAIVAAITLVTSVHAAEVIKPDIGEPLRDAAVTRAPDGTYFLTGTSSLQDAQGNTDFENNQGVKVWRSSDLQTWESLGLIFDLHRDVVRKRSNAHLNVWKAKVLPVLGGKPGERARRMTAPRLAHDGERFWISYSMNGYAAGAMFGKTEQIGGPFEDTQNNLAEVGGAPTGRSDATLFIDQDGSRYLVWGGGMIARLRPLAELSAKKLGVDKSGIEGPAHFLPLLMQDFGQDDGLPDRAAPYGVSVFLRNGQYHFLFTATTLREGGIHEDSYYAVSDGLLGPYSAPRPLIADSGRAIVFQESTGGWKVSYSDLEGQPLIVDFPTSPIDFVANAPQPKRGEVVESVPRLPVSEKPATPPQVLEWIKPLMDHPLRDAALCQGPGGSWYLTGTEATRAADGTLDFANNNGIRLWKSKDRLTWKDLGYVWDIDRDASRSPKSAWQLESHLDMTLGATPRIGRAITAPEMHYLKDTFWIVYSMNGSGIGLLKSTSGKADGPFEDFGRIVRHGRDGSLFQDADGAIYLVWGEGLYAPMAGDMTTIDGLPKALFANTAWYSRYKRRANYMGQWGSHLAKQGEWYIWTFTTRTARLGINSIDTMASWSRSLNGPWTDPVLMLANGGQSTLVRDGEGGWLATVSGEDEYSQWPYRAAITPVVSHGGMHTFGANKGRPNTALSLKEQSRSPGGVDFRAINSLQATALDCWIGQPDFLQHTIRDVWIGYMPDGNYYCSGSFWAVDGMREDVAFYRSSDMLHWEPLPPFYRQEQFGEDGAVEDVEALQAFIETDKNRDAKDWKTPKRQTGDTKMFHWNGDYYITTQVFRGPAGGIQLLKSTSGKAAGPYRWVREVPGSSDSYQDQDGSILHTRSAADIWRLENIESDPFEASIAPGQNLQPSNIIYSDDCEAGILRINDWYVIYTAEWTGSYDLNYLTAKSIDGPWQLGPRVLPWAGNGYLYQDKNQEWFWAYFNTNNDFATRSQNLVHLNMYPVFIGEENGQLIIEPKAVRKNRAALNKMGALWQTPK